MTADEVRSILQSKVDAAGTVKAWAEGNGVSQTYVGDVLKGYKQPSNAILAPLGLRRVVSYEIADPSSVASADPTSARNAGAGQPLPVPAPTADAQ